MAIKTIIIRLYFTQLRNETHVELNENLVFLIEKYDPATLGILLQYENYKRYYNNIAAKTLDQETAAVDDLLREFSTNPYNEYIGLLMLMPNDRSKQLYTENQKFKDLMSKRYTETVQRPVIRLKDARSETDKVLLPVNGQANYESFIRKPNVILERHKHIQAQERRRHHKPKPNDAKNETLPTLESAKSPLLIFNF